MKLARPVTLLLNSEEEVGSPISRAITERLALESAAVLVLEPAQGLAYKTARKGVGHYHVEVTGVGGAQRSRLREAATPPFWSSQN